MRIIMIGTGYVGLVSGACLAKLGHFVTCIDIDKNKIDMLNDGGCPLYEDGLPELLKDVTQTKNLTFHLGLPETLKDVDAVFLGVGTPQGSDGKADMRFIDAAFQELIPKLEKTTVVVTKSTVPVGTADRLTAWLKRERPELEGHLASNPEFLREGTAVQDFMQPDRIVSGARTEHGHAVLEKIYAPLVKAGYTHLQIDPQSAELAKYAANAFLATKICFINEMAALCEAVDGNVGAVSKAIGMDTRIGHRFLRAGPGYGGSCFPKDTSALANIAREAGTHSRITEAAMAANLDAQARVVERIEAMGDVRGKTIACLGLAFKPGTDDMRDSPALTIIPALQERGAVVKGIDPAAMEQARKQLDITYCQNVDELVKDADVLILMTEWPHYTSLDLKTLRSKMKSTAALADLRRVWTKKQAKESGFDKVYILGE